MFGIKFLCKNLKRKQNFINFNKFNFFWNKSEKIEGNIPVKDKDLEEIHNAVDLGPLIAKIKEENKLKPLLLPEKDKKYGEKLTVIMDMDDVLLFTFYPDEQEAYLNSPKREADFYLDLPEHNTYLNIYKRNHLDKFLNYIKENCEPILFCNGLKDYVDKVMDIIDQDKIFVHRLYQDSCNIVKYLDEDILEITKDLNRVNRNLARTVYIDSKPFTFWCNPDNCVPVLEYDGQFTEKDHKLLEVIETLEELKDEKDVRIYLNERFGLKKMLEESKML